MPLFDLPLTQLRSYSSDVTPPEDLREFWDATLREAQAFPLAATFEPVENYLTVIDTFDVTFAGYDCAPVKGWLHLPAHREPGEALPVVVQYIGYSGGRGLVNQDTRWAQAGYAHFIMDTRGQGYGGTLGETADPHSSAGEVAHAGLMTRGIGTREDYYYRRVYVDAFRAVEAAQSHPAVDGYRVVLAGVSQGGGIVVAVAGLVAGRLDGVVAALPDVPFLQDFPRAIDITPRGPYPEIAQFLARHRDRYDAMLAPALFRRRQPGPLGSSACAVLGSTDGRHLPAVYSLRQLQRLRLGKRRDTCQRAGEGDRGVQVQQPRRRPGTPVDPPAAVSAQDFGVSSSCGEEKTVSRLRLRTGKQ